MSDNTKTQNKTESKDSDEPNESGPKIKPKFGNPQSFRNQDTDKKGSQTFSRKPVKIVRHKG